MKEIGKVIKFLALVAVIYIVIAVIDGFNPILWNNTLKTIYVLAVIFLIIDLN